MDEDGGSEGGKKEANGQGGKERFEKARHLDCFISCRPNIIVYPSTKIINASQLF